MALTNMEGRRPNLVSKRERTVERERREGEKKKKRRRREAIITKVWNFGFFVWKLTLVMNSMRFGMNLWVCMMINLLKPRVLLGFHLIPKIMENKVGKTLNSTRRS